MLFVNKRFLDFVSNNDETKNSHQDENPFFKLKHTVDENDEKAIKSFNEEKLEKNRFSNSPSVSNVKD